MGWGERDPTDSTNAGEGSNAKRQEVNGCVERWMLYPEDETPWWAVSESFIEENLRESDLITGQDHAGSGMERGLRQPMQVQTLPTANIFMSHGLIYKLVICVFLTNLLLVNIVASRLLIC